MFPQVFGKYVLEREIAAGGMARVYEATLQGAGGFSKRLVVKQIRPELASDRAFVDRFVEEAKTTVELSHANIVPVYELGVERGIYFIAMELFEGPSLADILRETGHLEPDEGAYVGVEVCRALDYAHRKVAVVHRDVTPRNVLVDEEGAVRLIDFGIAAPAGASRDTKHDGDAIPADVLGSPGHMPPEQIQGTRLTPSTDVFAVAAMLIEAWTECAPFRRATVMECEKALREAPPPVSRYDLRLAPLDGLISSAIERDCRARPSSAEAFARPLRDFIKASDTGDIARRLGDRARRTRETCSPDTRSRAPSSGEELLDELERESRVGVTRTFALRGDVEVWTRPIERDPAVPDDPGSTRKLPSVAPAEGKQGSSNVSLAPLRSRRWLPAVVAVSAAAAVAVALRAREPRRDVTGPVEEPSSAPSGPLPARGPSRLREAALPRPRSVASVATAKPLPPVVARRDGAPSAKSVGTLTLSSEPPGMRVTIRGRSWVTPAAGISLRPGTYAVVFTFPATKETRTTTVEVASGRARTIHADFTGATPRLFVH